MHKVGGPVPARPVRWLHPWAIVIVACLGATFSTTGIIRFLKIKSPTHRDTMTLNIPVYKIINTLTLDMSSNNF